MTLEYQWLENINKMPGIDNQQFATEDKNFPIIGEGKHDCIKL